MGANTHSPWSKKTLRKDIYTERPADRERKMDRQTGRSTGRLTHRHTDVKFGDKHTNKERSRHKH